MWFIDSFFVVPFSRVTVGGGLERGGGGGGQRQGGQKCLFHAETATPAVAAAAEAVAAFCTRRSFAAVRRILAAAIAAPKPLSMLQTVTPGLDETRAESSGVRPWSEAPYLKFF